MLGDLSVCCVRKRRGRYKRYCTNADSEELKADVLPRLGDKHGVLSFLLFLFLLLLLALAAWKNPFPPWLDTSIDPTKNTFFLNNEMISEEEEKNVKES